MQCTHAVKRRQYCLSDTLRLCLADPVAHFQEDGFAVTAFDDETSGMQVTFI